MSELTNFENDDKKKSKKGKEDAFANITVLESPSRKISKIIEETLKHKIPVHLDENGYYIGGFYGLNPDTKNLGFVFAQDTSEENSLALYDNKGTKHLVKDFEDLVKFHNHIWGVYYKTSEDYKKPDLTWFPLMLQYGVLNILPGNSK